MAGDAMHAAAAKASNVENAVIGHGVEEGPFSELNNLNVERDDRYPIRVTVQFYKATSNGVVSAEDVAKMKADIDRVYQSSSEVGSLITQGETGRATEYVGCKVQPRDWWLNFWNRYERLGKNRSLAEKKLRKALGQDYESAGVTDLYVRNLLRKV